MLLVAGPTGTGKTTSLYALLHELRLLDCSVITIEDPVECQIDGISQIQVDEPHGLTFAEGIKAILRLDPDYMLVGEIRDGSSARAAVDAAATGRTLMSTIHTRDAVGSVTVLRNLGLADHEIAAVLSIIVSQRLVRRLCPHCRTCGPPTEREARWLDTVKVPVPDTTWHAVGCDKCRDIGYRGRMGVFEVWRLDEHDYGLILDHADERSIRDRLCHTDHNFLLADALVKVESGITSIEELRSMGGFGWTRSLERSSK
jgi:general secretion pathway protein E